MTVPEPMREGAGERRWLRRVAFSASALALTIAFALSLSGIAATHGTLSPDGEAAALAAKQTTRATDAAAHRGCHRSTRTRSSSGRV
jgi:hypothetical protein